MIINQKQKSYNANVVRLLTFLDITVVLYVGYLPHVGQFFFYITLFLFFVGMC